MGKYMKYAIGEIILVVIGILIALQINNWNQDRILEIEEQTIVKNIHAEYLQNKKIITTTIASSITCEDALRSLMNLIGKDRELLEDYNIDSLMFLAFDPYFFRPSENTISGLIQSGRLELLKDQELVELIYEWGRTIKALNDRTSRIAIKIDSQVYPYLSKRYSLKDMDAYGPLNWKDKTDLVVDKYQIFEELEFENLMDDFLYWVADIKTLYIELDTLIDDILRETER
jgi:hypothetical protein